MKKITSIRSFKKNFKKNFKKLMVGRICSKETIEECTSGMSNVNVNWNVPFNKFRYLDCKLSIVDKKHWEYNWCIESVDDYPEPSPMAKKIMRKWK